MERGRWHAMLGGAEHTAKAIKAFRAAERMSPAQVQNSPLVRETVGHLLNQAQRTAGGKELRGLAWRMGMV